jgi:antitoxin FitA
MIAHQMAQLIVRDIEEKIVRQLKERAGAHGISMEEEHRRILRDALFPKAKGRISFKKFLLSMPNAGEESDFERVSDKGRKIIL